MGKRGPKPQLAEAQLLHAAYKIVAEKGLDALTIGGLAKALSVSPSGLYRYFPSKGALLVALQRQSIAAYANQLQHAREDAPPTMLNAQAASLWRISHLWLRWPAESARNPAQHRLIDAFLSAPVPILSDDDARVVDGFLEPILVELDQAINDAVNCGALEEGPTRQRTYLLWATFHGLDHFRKRDRIQPLSLRTGALAYALLHALFRGWGADSSTLKDLASSV